MQRNRWPEKNLRLINQYTDEASTGMAAAVGHLNLRFKVVQTVARCTYLHSSLLECCSPSHAPSNAMLLHLRGTPTY